MYINDPLTATKANTHTHTDRTLHHASAPERAYVSDTVCPNAQSGIALIYAAEY